MVHAAKGIDAALAVMSADRLALRPHSMDIAILTFVLFHLADPIGGLREVSRVLQPGGLVGLVVWGRRLNVPGFAIWQEELDAEGAAQDPRDPAVMRHSMMDENDKLTRLLVEAGFTDVRTWTQCHSYQWTAHSLMELQSEYGEPSRRLRSLSLQAQANCRARVQTRLEVLTPDELGYRPEVLYATGCAPV